ncbi:MAG TPA: DUF1640 domain-containing protein [Casimicrobiaceae bacterium]
MAIDTLKTADNLTRAGMPEAQARAIAESLREVEDDAQWITKPWLAEQLAPVKTDVAVLKWMCGANTGMLIAVLALLLRFLMRPG